MATPQHYTAKGPTAYTFSQKWGDDPFTALGHTQVPDALIGYAARLRLVPEECWLIVCVLKFKHTPDNPYPSQARLAQILGQSEDTVRRLLKRIQRKGLVHVERVRGDLGHYTHSVYDFTPLRAALNEAFYEDHPQERPKTAPPEATAQNCTVAATTPQNVPQPPRKIARNYPAKCAVTTMQNCGLNQSRKEDEKTESETFNVRAAAGELQPAPENAGRAQTANVVQPVRKTSLQNPVQQAKTALQVAPNVLMAQEIVQLTGDEKSRRRFEQLAGLTRKYKAEQLWETAFKATRARLHKSTEPLDAPGAYFCAILGRLFLDAAVYMPVGTKEEREDIRRQIKESFAQADALADAAAQKKAQAKAGGK